LFCFFKGGEKFYTFPVPISKRWGGENVLEKCMIMQQANKSSSFAQAPLLM